MQIKKQDKKIGLIEVIPETLDDLWHLSHIIEKNDYVSSITTRRIQDKTGDKLRSDRGIKKTFFLGIRIKEINFHKYTETLRLTGIIKSGPEELIPLGAHHTINVQINNSIRIQKTWNKWALDRLNQAINLTKRPITMIIALEDNITDIGLITQYGVEYKGPIRGEISGKQNISKDRSKKINLYYTEITELITQYDNVNKYILIGPGFTKEGYYTFLQENNKDITKKVIIESTGSGGHAGIQEILKSGIISEFTKEVKIATEINEVEKFLEEIGKSSTLITYGKKETKKASDMGSVEKLLVIDHMVRNKNIQNLMNNVENMGGTVLIISSEHDAGKQLESLGSIAAFLRYPIQ